MIATSMLELFVTLLEILLLVINLLVCFSNLLLFCCTFRLFLVPVVMVTDHMEQSSVPLVRDDLSDLAS